MERQRAQFVGFVALIAVAVSGVNLFSPAVSASAASVVAQSNLYKSCVNYKLTAPLDSQATVSATEVTTLAGPTQAATMSATTQAGASSGDNIAFMSIVGADSEACYVASETFLQNNMMHLPSGFNAPVGVTKTISGDIALDRTNVANSQIGDITINISEFKSDDARRDGFIRQRFLESNKYPFATLTNSTAIGLPSGAYQDGQLLKFQIKGTLTVHNTKRDTVFDATGFIKDGSLVVTAITTLKMSEMGVTVPDIGGLLKVDDSMDIVVNIVAREGQASATAAATAAK